MVWASLLFEYNFNLQLKWKLNFFQQKKLHCLRGWKTSKTNKQTGKKLIWKKSHPKHDSVMDRPVNITGCVCLYLHIRYLDENAFFAFFAFCLYSVESFLFLAIFRFGRIWYFWVLLCIIKVKRADWFSCFVDHF